MAAARELLNRGFGKSARTEALTPQTITNRRSGEGRNPETPPPGDAQPARTTPEPERPARTEPIEASEPTETPPLTPHSSPLTPVKANPESASSQPSLSLSKRPLSLLTPLHSLPARSAPTPTRPVRANRPRPPRKHGLRTRPPRRTHRRRRHRQRHRPGHPRPRKGSTSLLQAKRWTNQVGESEIRNFSGSLDAHGATRGILITTSDFTGTARKTAKTISIGGNLFVHIRQKWGERPRARPPHAVTTASESHPTPPNIPEVLQDENHHTHHT